MTSRQLVIPTIPVLDFGLGRGLVNHDERSKAHRAVRGLTALQQPRERSWRRGAAYDQGQTSKCVPYTGKGILNTLTMSGLVPYRTRTAYGVDQWYDGARDNDQWAGRDYDGTSGLGLLRYLTKTGIIKSYDWCFGLDDALRTLSWVGPLGIGIGWTEDMFYPDAKGFIRPTGEDVGGHEIEVTANLPRERAVVLTNSWGTSWGNLGRAKLSYVDFEALLANNGDAFTITG